MQSKHSKSDIRIELLPAEALLQIFIVLCRKQSSDRDIKSWFEFVKNRLMRHADFPDEYRAFRGSKWMIWGEISMTEIGKDGVRAADAEGRYDEYKVEVLGRLLSFMKQNGWDATYSRQDGIVFKPEHRHKSGPPDEAHGLVSVACGTIYE
jgi:hypothetical protein